MNLGELLPWRVAARWADPRSQARRTGRADPDALVLDRLGRMAAWRSVLGMATLVAASAATRAPWEVLEDEGWGKATKTIAVTLVLVPVLMVVVYRVTDKAHRGVLRKRVRSVVGRWALMLVTSFGPMAPIILASQGHIDGDQVKAALEDLGLLALPLYFLLLAAILWLPVYLCFVAFWATRTSIWAGVFHPLLGPTVAAVVVVATTAVQLLDADTKGLAQPVWLTLTLGGLVTTLALTGAEYAVLRGRLGVTWRAPGSDA